MKSMVLQFVLILVCALGADPFYGQDPLGPGPKKARTPGDYKPRTLKGISVDSDAESRRGSEDEVIVLSDILPSRVRATYQGSARSLPQRKKDVLHRWAQLYAGAPQHYTAHYETELLFSEEGLDHWLAVRKESLAQFEKEIKKGEAVDLYLIRMGGVRTAKKWESLLLVESFKS